jgi:DNA-binding MarR family transcriptional regulator
MKLGQRLRAIDAGTGFTPSELSVLGTVARHGPLRSSDLAHIEGVNPTMASRLLSHLVEEEALSRTVDPSDRRVTLVVATAYGRHLHDRLRAERARALDTLLRMLPDRQRSAISSALPGLEALADLLKDRPR